MTDSLTWKVPVPVPVKLNCVVQQYHLISPVGNSMFAQITDNGNDTIQLMTDAGVEDA